MGDQIHITRVVDGFSSHTQMRARSRGRGSSSGASAARERLIDATVAVIAEGSDPRLTQSRARP